MHLSFLGKIGHKSVNARPHLLCKNQVNDAKQGMEHQTTLIKVF